jgi:ketosteroid isomerase-like protein
MTSTNDTQAAIERFHQAVNSHDVEALTAAITDDCFFESTLPPDGDSYEGKAAIGDFFSKLFDTAVERTFDVEELVIVGDRGIMRWRHRWIDQAGTRGHVRGVDLFRVRDGKVAEKLSYVKG